jgi:hypothetical protein
MGSLKYFIDLILPAIPWTWDLLTCDRNEYQESYLGVKAAGA